MRGYTSIGKAPSAGKWAGFAGEAQGHIKGRRVRQSGHSACLGSCPHTPTRQLFHSLWREMAGCRHVAGEGGINTVQTGIGAGFFAGSVGRGGRPQRGVLTAEMLSVVMPSLSSSPLITNLPPNTPMEPVMLADRQQSYRRSWQSNNHRSRRVAHGNNDGFSGFFSLNHRVANCFPKQRANRRGC